ncbi:UNVERIFIED_CONTAM: hypothetical protein HDU68_004476 [Siphonaria sp. JEL0065]|nr:hypothetical protein HDU68_004476 [Siphonaria sp. JEL0065]
MTYTTPTPLASLLIELRKKVALVTGGCRAVESNAAIWQLQLQQASYRVCCCRNPELGQKAIHWGNVASKADANWLDNTILNLSHILKYKAVEGFTRALDVELVRMNAISLKGLWLLELKLPCSRDWELQ